MASPDPSSDKRKKSIWTWLGPVLGVLGTIVVVGTIIALGYFYYSRRKSFGDQHIDAYIGCNSKLASDTAVEYFKDKQILYEDFLTGNFKDKLIELTNGSCTAKDISTIKEILKAAIVNLQFYIIEIGKDSINPRMNQNLYNFVNTNSNYMRNSMNIKEIEDNISDAFLDTRLKKILNTFVYVVKAYTAQDSHICDILKHNGVA